MEEDLLIKRTFIIGDEWIYYKFYLGPKTADRFLREIINPMCKSLLNSNIIDRWFFIRYQDPDYHVRIRFHITETDNILKIILSIKEATIPYVYSDLIWKVQIDTYKRELERYGEQCIAHSEEVFFQDSRMIIELLSFIIGDSGENIRWLFSLKAIDYYLDNYNLTDSDKLLIMEKLKLSFAKEFHSGRHLKAQLDRKFRLDRKQITDFLLNNHIESFDTGIILTLLEDKNFHLKNVVRSIFEMYPEKNSMDFINLVSVHIHMMINRIFRSKQRQHELVIYDYMWRFYRSKIAIASKGSKRISKSN